jgi:hypothetical protein
MDSLPIDICSFAAYTALQCTVIPRTEVYHGESGLPEDFEVSGDICDAASLAGLITVGAPLCITTSKVKRTFPTSLHFTSLHFPLHFISPNFAYLHFTSLHFNPHLNFSRSEMKFCFWIALVTRPHAAFAHSPLLLLQVASSVACGNTARAP